MPKRVEFLREAYRQAGVCAGRHEHPESQEPERAGGPSLHASTPEDQIEQEGRDKKSDRQRDQHGVQRMTMKFAELTGFGMIASKAKTLNPKTPRAMTRFLQPVAATSSKWSCTVG